MIDHLLNVIPLSAGGLVPGRGTRCGEQQRPSVGYHSSVVDAEPFVRSIHLGTPLEAHNPHHLLQPQVTSYSPHQQHLLRPTMSHSPFCNIPQSWAYQFQYSTRFLCTTSIILFLNYQVKKWKNKSYLDKNTRLPLLELMIDENIIFSWFHNSNFN